MKKRLLCFLLAFCLMVSMGSVLASATGVETKVIIGEGGRLTITPTGYSNSYDNVFHEFTGQYILGGSLANLVFSGEDGATYNLVAHDLDLYAGEFIAIYFENSNTTLNLTVCGQFYSHSVTASVGCVDGATGNKIKTTLTQGSQVYWDASEKETLSGDVAVVDQNDAPLTNEFDAPGVFGVSLGDEIIDHYVETKKGANGCVYDCPDCDLLDGAEAPHTPTENGKYIDDDTCEQTCSVCELTYHGEHYYSEYVYVNDNTCGVSCSICKEVYETYSHWMQYTPEEDGHTAYCENCEHQWEGVSPHVPGYSWVDAQHCGAVCLDCGVSMGDSLPHSYEKGEYTYLDEESCIPVCDNCQGYDESNQERIVPHDFSAYDYYNDANCITICSHCESGQTDEQGEYVLTPHKFTVKGKTVPANQWQEEHSEVLCEKCDYTRKQYNKEKSIVIEMPTYYYPDQIGASDEMGGLAVYRNGVLWKHVYNEENDVNALPFDKNASYVFKLLNTTTPETALTIWIPGMEKPIIQSENLLEDGYDIFDTVAAYNVADYGKLQEALDKVPADMSLYTEKSAMAVANVVKSIQRMLPSSHQSLVDEQTKNVKIAVASLEKRGENDPMHGVVHIKNTSADISPESYTLFDTDSWEEIKTVSYDGDYVLFGTRVMDEVGKEDYSKGAFWVCNGAQKSIALANLWSIGIDGEAGIVDNSSANLTLYGSNVIADGATHMIDENDEEIFFSDFAGINLPAGNSLTVNGNGSLLSLGQDNCAGIGGNEEQDDAGDITINGGTVFAFSAGDAAGIGGGYKGKAGKITINGGTVYANCLHDDGSGIGTGEDGKGGTVTINGGTVIALSYDDDGAGIGSGDKGHIDSITINGGVIVAGSDDGAAIGGGSDSDGYGGKIIVNGGVVMPHIHHDVDENFMGNGNSSSKDLDEDNFVQLNGGVVITQGTKGIYPVKVGENGGTVTHTDVPVPQGKEEFPFDVIVNDGSVITLTPVDGKVTVLASEFVYTRFGDVNADGKIDAKDALETLKISVQKRIPTPMEATASDANRDGVTNAKDALEMLKYAVKKPSVLG